MKYHKVSELEVPELHYIALLQLYKPWRNKKDLKRDFLHICSEIVKDDIMRNIEKNDAFYGKFDLDDLLDEVLDGVDHDFLDENE